jgi:hypothetical protein
MDFDGRVYWFSFQCRWSLTDGREVSFSSCYGVHLRPSVPGATCYYQEVGS